MIKYLFVTILHVAVETNSIVIEVVVVVIAAGVVAHSRNAVRHP